MTEQFEIEPIVFVPASFHIGNLVLTSYQVQQLLGVSGGAFRAWVSRKQFPGPDGLLNGKTPYWKMTNVIEYLRNAPGGRLGYPVE